MCFLLRLWCGIGPFWVLSIDVAVLLQFRINTFNIYIYKYIYYVRCGWTGFIKKEAGFIIKYLDVTNIHSLDE